MRPMTAVYALALAGLCACATSKPPQVSDPPLQSESGSCQVEPIELGEISAAKTGWNKAIFLCEREDRPAAVRPWRGNAYTKLIEFRAAAYRDEDVFSIGSKRLDECPDLHQHACYGDSTTGAVYCDELLLERLLLAAAGYTSYTMLTFLERINREPQSGEIWSSLLRHFEQSPFGAMEAYRFATILFDAKSNEQIRSSRLSPLYLPLARVLGPEGAIQAFDKTWKGARGIQELDLDPAEGLNRVGSPDERVFLGSMWWLYRASVSYLFAFMLGHELSHAQAGCFFTAPAAVERSGLLGTLASYQLGGPFKGNPPSTSELNADRCGLRALRSTVAYYEGKTSLERMRQIEIVGKRMAIDLLATFIMVGSDRSAVSAYVPEVHEGRLSYWPPMSTRSGYLYEASRLMLFAKEVQMTGTNADRAAAEIAICGQAAERLADGVLRAAVNSGTPLREVAQCLEGLRLPISPGVFQLFKEQRGTDFSCGSRN